MNTSCGFSCLLFPALLGCMFYCSNSDRGGMCILVHCIVIVVIMGKHYVHKATVHLLMILSDIELDSMFSLSTIIPILIV